MNGSSMMKVVTLTDLNDVVVVRIDTQVAGNLHRLPHNLFRIHLRAVDQCSGGS